MTVPLDELKDEITNDTRTLGLTAAANAGDFGTVARLLNTSGLSAESIDVTSVPAAEVLSAMVWSEFETLSATAQRGWLSIVGLDNVPVKNPTLRGQIAGIWAAGTTTRSNLTALQTRTASRCEAVWGENEHVNVSQVREAWLRM